MYCTIRRLVFYSWDDRLITDRCVYCDYQSDTLRAPY